MADTETTKPAATQAHEPTEKEKAFKIMWVMRWDWPHAHTEAAIRDNESPWPTFAAWLNQERVSLDLLRVACNKFAKTADGETRQRGPKLYALREEYDAMTKGREQRRTAGKCGICSKSGYAIVEDGALPCICTAGQRKMQGWRIDGAKQHAAIQAAVAARQARWDAAGVRDDQPATAEDRAAMTAAMLRGAKSVAAGKRTEPARATADDRAIAEVQSVL